MTTYEDLDKHCPTCTCDGHNDLLAALREVSLCFGTGEASEEWWAEQHDNYVPEGRNSVDCRNDVLERARAVIAKAEQS